MNTSLLGLEVDHPPVRVVAVEDLGHWVNAAWKDFTAAPILSLAYGLTFVAFGYVVFAGLQDVGLGSLMPSAIACFFLIAPITAVGLYEVCRRKERGQAAGIGDSLAAFRRNPSGLATMGLILMLSMAAWMQLALLIFMFFFHEQPPALDDFVLGVLSSPQVVPFLFFGTAVGYVIATIVFSITAVSIPMLLDRPEVTARHAICTSMAAVRRNYLVMLGWAATIVLLLGIGIATFFIGLAVTLPLAAYGTWHAYKALVE